LIPDDVARREDSAGVGRINSDPGMIDRHMHIVLTARFALVGADDDGTISLQEFPGDSRADLRPLTASQHDSQFTSGFRADAIQGLLTRLRAEDIGPSVITKDLRAIERLQKCGRTRVRR
jgi:hypothetical protein